MRRARRRSSVHNDLSLLLKKTEVSEENDSKSTTPAFGEQVQTQ